MCVPADTKDHMDSSLDQDFDKYGMNWKVALVQVSQLGEK